MKNNYFKVTILFFLILSSTAAFSQEYGLVLSGGGGKGAYEVGVWKALQEYGIAQRIVSISGASVGGLNSAFFSCATQEQIENIWINLVPRYLVPSKGEYFLSQEGLGSIIDMINFSTLNNSSWPRVHVDAVRDNLGFIKTFIRSSLGRNTSYFELNLKKSDEIKKYLLATAAMPVICKPVELPDMNTYVDGGTESAGGDNTPIAPIIKDNNDRKTNIQTIFVVYLNENPKRRIRQIDYDNVELVEILPTIDLGGIFEGTTNFTQSRIRMLIKQGYQDTVNVLKAREIYPVASRWFEVEEQ